MTDFEAEARKYLAGLAWQTSQPAWLVVNHDGWVIAGGGDLAAYDLPAVGSEPIPAERIAFLTGLLPLKHDSEILECVTTGRGRPADIHLLSRTDNDFVLLVDASKKELRQRELQQKANELDLLRAKQARLIADLDAFAHTVAHDLRGPLAAIIGLAEVMLDEPATLNQFQREGLDGVIQSGWKMVQIMDELLLLAGVRKQTVTPRPIDMAAVVAEVLKRLAPAIRDAKAGIEMPPSWPIALGHAPWVEEVWVNFISNAIKYGGQPPQIWLGGEEQSDGSIRFWVRDNGQGVPVGRRVSLFTEHAESDKDGKTGHGLGLAITRRIAERLNGSVNYAEAKGGGSIFSFTLPQGSKDEVSATEEPEDPLTK